MPRHTEPAANRELGGILGGMLPAYDVRAENTRQIVDDLGLQPDILIAASGRSPVVVEAEFMPAYGAEREAQARLGLGVSGTARAIDAAIALRYPNSVADAYDLTAAVSDARLSYCVLYADETRFPESGWLDGNAEDLAELIRLVSVPQRAVDAAADALEKGIDRAASILTALADSKPGVISSIAKLLGMSEVIQTYRMAGAIVANAMVFHERLAGQHGVEPLSLLCSVSAGSPKSNMLDAWARILEVNYFPIFALARDIVCQLPAAEAAQLLTNLRTTVEDVAATGANQAHDLTGRIFQRLIADRKFLATFYTLPASAALLARLAVAKMEVDWGDADAIGALRVGDFACGTGALLSAVYERIAARHESAGGDPAALHPTMMEEVLYGCDVMPSAIHITGSTLSGAQLAVGFGKSRLYTLAYGRQEDGDVRIGSLELMQSSSTMTLFNTSDPAMRTGSAGEETAAQVVVDVEDEGFDLVIMNPPFTSNTKHYNAEEGVSNAAFAAFDASSADQTAMADRMKQKAANTCYNGYAGLGSAFAGLADRKVKPGGVVAFVLPFTAINGSSWAKFREMIATRYADVTIVSIAANGYEMSFSSDTGMAECLIIGRKPVKNEKADGRARFVSLPSRPAGFVGAAETAKSILSVSETRRIEDGPYGGTPISCGEVLAGEILDAPIGGGGGKSAGWGRAPYAPWPLAQP